MIRLEILIWCSKFPVAKITSFSFIKTKVIVLTWQHLNKSNTLFSGDLYNQWQSKLHPASFDLSVRRMYERDSVTLAPLTTPVLGQSGWYGRRYLRQQKRWWQILGQCMVYHSSPSKELQLFCAWDTSCMCTNRLQKWHLGLLLRDCINNTSFSS